MVPLSPFRGERGHKLYLGIREGISSVFGAPDPPLYIRKEE